MATPGTAAAASNHVGTLPLGRAGGRVAARHGENRWCPVRSSHARPVPMSVSTLTLSYEHRACGNQFVFEDWRIASSLTSAYFPTDGDGDEDDDEYYVQYKHHLRKVVQAALKNLDGQSIFLTGMMGSGKSTIGEILAQNLQYGFVDRAATSWWKRYQVMIPCQTSSRTWERRVSEALRFSCQRYSFACNVSASIKRFAVESRALQWLCNGIDKLRRPVVVALGGGALVQPENWIIAKHGIVVYIDVPSEILAKRVVAAGTHSRPLFPPRCNEINAQKLLDVLYNQREEAYGMARIRVPIRDLSAKLRLLDASTIPPALVAFEVLKKIEELGGHPET